MILSFLELTSLRPHQILDLTNIFPANRTAPKWLFARCAKARLLGLRHYAQIRFRRLPTLRVLLLGVVVRHRAGDDDVLAILPVHWRRHLVLGGKLQRVDDA